ncbi:1-aminocyclopropane-1-carboxylate synthase 7 [Xylaria bambusicola]|uniref:1-aminocyclopropane-1-carboxylate synthase 7 n=1 Tax=Xylaria bambusicola TaxID=326684 RepID=UPI00200747A2|nr:1-aminocyclopropane-1-carboxylate synthase 7 [Xylaria bambusicola]KAI0517010.1 1-aminocyclopropane-1-carboxylate synthase 7 [Xylaria bambusicola]
MDNLEFCGLSKRGVDNVAEIWPGIKKAANTREKDRVNSQEQSLSIDMATSENWVLRQELVQLYKDAIQNGLTSQHLSYPDGFNGDVRLVDALVQFLNSYFSPLIPVQGSHIATAPGAAFALDALLFNICDPGDGLLIASPAWNGFNWLIGVRSGVKPIFVQLENLDDAISPKIILALEDALHKSIAPIKGLLLANPNNPLGTCYPEEVLKSIIRFCHEKKIHLISDEIYAMSGFENPDHPDPVPFVSLLQIDVKGMGCDLSRMHAVWSTSKDLGSSGLRVGCCITQDNGALATGLALTSNTQVSSLAAVATAALLTSSELPRLLKLNAERLSESYLKIRDVLKKYCIDHIPTSRSPYVFAKIAPNLETWEEEDVIIKIFRSEGLQISMARSYHVPENEKGWTRLNFALEPSKLDEALTRLDRGILRISQRGRTTAT